MFGTCVKYGKQSQVEAGGKFPHRIPAHYQEGQAIANRS